MGVLPIHLIMSLLSLFNTSSLLFFFLIWGLTLSQSTSIIYLRTTISPTTTTSIVSVRPPTAVSSSNSYTLLGCYNEVPISDGDRAVGAAGEYLSPSITPEILTAPICLAACSRASVPGKKGNYTYVALENSQYVLLLFIPSKTKKVLRIDSNSYCSTILENAFVVKPSRTCQISLTLLTAIQFALAIRTQAVEVSGFSPSIN
jgi:hypothetical protein